MPDSASHDRLGNEDFGAVVRRGRIAAGLTQEELAERTGMSVRAIGDIERGRTAHPRQSSVRLLAQTLRLPVACGDQLAEAARPAGQPDHTVPRIVPRQLPAAVRHFVGRRAELATLTRLLDEMEDPGGAIAISAVGGTAGVGKTALAVRWAHLVADRFPDGQLYVNLRGYDPGQPVTTADALAGFLRALGVPGQDIPPEADERAAQYRTLLAGQRILVVLDNASEVEQVRPLLPGTPACAALVTSRDSLAGLVAEHGAQRLDLDLLPLQDALDLLRALIGPRVDDAPEAAAALAGQCSRLPLALRVAAELAAARPETPLLELADELADRRRLDLLDAGGDPRIGLRAVFSWSCRHLRADSARMFRLLGLHPSPDFDCYAAAALTGTPAEQSRHLLDLLARAHLIQRARPGRYSLHDLLRAYACELAAEQDKQDERQAALTRLFDYYLHSAATAMDTLYPAERHRRPRIPVPATRGPPLAGDAGAARDWLDSERVGLVAVTRHTASHDWPGHATRLAVTLFRYLDVGGYYSEAVAVHDCARRAARQTGDRAAEADALASLGLVGIWQDRYRQATGYLQQSLAVCREIGDQNGQARALLNLGLVDARQGRYQQAAGYLRQSLAIYRATGDQTGEVRALHNLGLVDARQGRYQQATGHHEQGLALCRKIGDGNGEARHLANLGDVYRRQGCYQQAIDCHQQALTLHRETGDRLGEAHTLADLGHACLQQGRLQRAAGRYEQALALFQAIGDTSGLAESLNGLGEVLLAAGQPDQASARHTVALGLASQIGDKYEQARSHNGLAHSHCASGDCGQARRQWHAALALYTDLAAPEADQVRACLSRAGEDGRRER